MTQPAPETGTPGTTPPAAPATGTPEPAPQADPPAPPAGDQPPKPTETVEFWKQKAREQEQRAKANADAATKLQQLEDGQKTEIQKATEAAARAKAEADAAKAEVTRWKVAATHGIREENFDLLGTGTEEELTTRAKRVAVMQQAADAQVAAANAAAQAGQAGSTVPPAPPAGTVPGLTPGQQQAPDDSYPEGWFPPKPEKATRFA